MVTVMLLFFRGGGVGWEFGYGFDFGGMGERVIILFWKLALDT